MPVQEPTEQNDAHEHTPLLRGHVTPTPLPARQMFGLLALLLAEPVMCMSILPYINEVCPAFLVPASTT